MKKVIFLCFTLPIVGIYLFAAVGAFINWDFSLAFFDVSEWQKSTRFICVLWYVIGVMGSIGLAIDLELIK